MIKINFEEMGDFFVRNEKHEFEYNRVVWIVKKIDGIWQYGLKTMEREIFTPISNIIDSPQCQEGFKIMLRKMMERAR